MSVLSLTTAHLALLCLLGAVGCSLRPVRAETTPPAPQIASIVADYYGRGKFDGVVLVAERGKVLFEQSFGMANREKGLSNTSETIYPICSVTKQFTALLAMQLVEKGTLRLDDVITDYLPDFRHDTGSHITLKQLLNHTSGLPTLDEALPEQAGVPGFYARKEPQFADAAFVVKNYCQDDLKTIPGEKFNYNNADYVVLSLILEKVTGKSYARLLQERILNPLGMKHSGMLGDESTQPIQAVGYVKEKDEVKRESHFNRANFGAAGAMYSTVGDMLRWNWALDTDRLLSRPFREIMFTPDPKLGFVALGSWVYAGRFPDVKEISIAYRTRWRYRSLQHS